MNRLFIALGWLSFTFVMASASQAEEVTRRWVYLQLNLQVAENVDQAEAIARRAKAAGYNGIVLADYKLNILDRVPDHYFRHAERFRKTCDELGLEIIPAVCPIGYSDGLLAHNPNLAEGIPVQDAEFIVGDATAQLASRAKNLLPGGGFEEAKGDAAVGWSYQDFPGKASFLDQGVKHGGASSLRFENLAQNAAPAGNGRVTRALKVRPWQLLHARAWIKTEDFASAGSVRMMAIGGDGRILSHSNLGVKRTQDWTEHHVMLNTLANEDITFYVGCWSGTTGKLWVDDVSLAESAFVNLIRRDACPLTVKTADGAALVEGKDFAPLIDKQMGMVPYAGSYDVYHEPPRLALLPGGKAKRGDRLLVSYYHTVTIYDNQVTCCLGDPEVFAVLKKQVASVEKLFKPQTYFLSHDEIRLANWCPGCQREGQTAGELLAQNVRHCAGVVREINPDARLCVWSDMFDPHHNATKGFYLVNGDLAGSWEGLPEGMTVINWNHGKADQSLPFFARRGHSQVLAGYYDSDPQSIRGWLEAGRGLKGVNGAMYTTWTNNFEHLEAFAKAAWGGGK